GTLQRRNVDRQGAILGIVGIESRRLWKRDQALNEIHSAWLKSGVAGITDLPCSRGRTLGLYAKASRAHFVSCQIASMISTARPSAGISSAPPRSPSGAPLMTAFV